MRQRRILIVGQAPSRTSDPAKPFGEGPGRARLELMIGFDLDECDVVNLLPEWPGRCGKGDAFPLQEARDRAEWVLGAASGRRLVVAVGLNVARAMGLKAVTAPATEWRPGLPRPILVVPHPSGISRWWNDEARVVSAALWSRAAAASLVRG